MCPKVGPEGWLRCFAHPFGGVVCKGLAQYPAFALDTLLLLRALQECQMGFFWSFCILSIIRPKCTCMQLFSVPYSFFVFCCLETFVQVQALQQRISGPRSQVPACLEHTGDLG